MAYTITLTDGSVFASVTDGTVNQSSSVTLIGKNYAGYGDFLDENFIQMLENFSSDSSGGNPTSAKLSSPLRGQLWWDKTNSLLKVWAGSAWKTISAATASASAPTGNVTGDLWFDTTNQQLKVWTGAAFLVVGPAYSASQGTSGAIPETILDSVGATKYITSLYVNNNRVAIVYDGASFVPQASLLATFPTIYPGITLTTTNSPIFAGTANNSSRLNSLTSSQFMRSDTNTATTGTLSATGNITTAGFFVGNFAGNITGNLNVPGSNTQILFNTNGNADAASQLVFNKATNVLTVTGTSSTTGNVIGGNVVTAGAVSATGVVSAASNVIAAGNVSGGNVIAAANVNAVGMSASGNIRAAIFLGDGGYLSNISAGVSVTQIQNGNSRVQIGASDGNANITIGSTSNVAVFTTAGAVFTNITTPNIEKSGTNAVGNIGNTASWFNQAWISQLNATTVSASGNVRTAGFVSATGNVDGGNLRTVGTISSTGNITTSGFFVGTFAGNISGNLTVPGANTQVLFNTNGNADAVAGFTYDKASNIMTVLGIVSSAGNVSATGNVIGGNVVTAALVQGATVSATGNVQGGNLRTTGLISSTGNISGNFFIGNGSLLTGIAGGSGSSISNGTSQINIATSGGNANVTIGGTSNVVVVATTGLFVTGLASVTGNVTGGNLTVGTGTVNAGNIVNTNANGVGNIGSSTTYFNRLFATATTALYADVAERFEADEYLEPGTVVELGGSKEITRSNRELSENIFGVISTRPAMLMNGGAGEDVTHPPVAMTGRVPVRVIGQVRKGDRLVSAGDGVARAAQLGEATAFNVIGRALEDKFNVDNGYIEAIVTIK